MTTKHAGPSPARLLTAWGVTRLVLLLFVLKVFVFPGPDVTTDVSVVYRGWYEVLRTGAFPQADVTWQYPPAAALAVLSPALLPFLDYASAFFVLAFLADLAVLTLLRYAGGVRPGRSPRGAWMWVAGVPLLGPTVYARYDVMVTAVAVAALVAGARHPRLMGALTGLAALLKVWPVLLLAGAVRRRAWAAAAVTAGALCAVFALTMPGAFAFLAFQRDRGTEVESLGALVLHGARWFGWDGEVLLHYGSVEFLGPYVDVVSDAALGLSAVAFGWLLLWRLSARRFGPHTLAEAAFTAVLLFTVTSRVISPQYLVWLIGLAAVCLCRRGSRMTLPAVLVLAACPVTVLEFPVWFADVVASTPLGVGLLFLRNGLLVAAALTAALRLWRSTVPGDVPAPVPGHAARTSERAASPS
ncbi:glycosyltransferase family 87 protein [Streptomyces phaeofaciens JCM 4814]|uniref:Membrane protein n=1 Tax=Streptomyces phaeofaciens TaxID=68254 RepID=A0A918HNC2_9ACTN|nr:glycosyltransferase family 87 protein [Streptomyces phaeofaciens]GGT86363.1 membrane protein [Streptomyces phaeofaciens]